MALWRLMYVEEENGKSAMHTASGCGCGALAYDTIPLSSVCA